MTTRIAAMTAATLPATIGIHLRSRGGGGGGGFMIGGPGPGATAREGGSGSPVSSCTTYNTIQR